MAVAGLLAQYLAIKNQITECEQQKIRWDNMQTAMSKKLSEQENCQTKWDSASGSFYDDWGNTKEFKADGTVFQNKDGQIDKQFRGKDKDAVIEAYAHAKVPKFNEELYNEYTDLDIEYSTMSGMYETLLTELDAQKQGLEAQLGEEAKQTNILGG